MSSELRTAGRRTPDFRDPGASRFAGGYAAGRRLHVIDLGGARVARLGTVRLAVLAARALLFFSTTTAPACPRVRHA
ncbi:MAG TPA: hypothetical protein VF541_23580 [Longimicrobium sp.]|jgi:hypothetical protein